MWFIATATRNKTFCCKNLDSTYDIKSIFTMIAQIILGNAPYDKDWMKMSVITSRDAYRLKREEKKKREKKDWMKKLIIVGF